MTMRAESTGTTPRADGPKKRAALATGVTTDKVAALLVFAALALLVLLRRGFLGALGD